MTCWRGRRKAALRDLLLVVGTTWSQSFPTVRLGELSLTPTTPDELGSYDGILFGTPSVVTSRSPPSPCVPTNRHEARSGAVLAVGAKGIRAASVATQVLLLPDTHMNLAPSASPAVLHKEHLDASPSITKRALTDVLLATGIPVMLPLDVAQHEYPAIGRIRDQLVAHFDDGPCLCEFEAALLLPLGSSELRDWPAWYVRLPDAWRDDVARMARREEISPHLQRDERDPWHIAQRVAIVSEFHGDDWFVDARRIEADDRDLDWTFSEGARSAGLVVLFECAGTISVAAYPVDEYLMGALLAGDGASCRHPLFDLPLVEVQALTRAIEDGARPSGNPNVVRLPVVHLLDADTLCDAVARSPWIQEATDRLGPRVRCSLHDDGTLGSLSEVSAWHPPAWGEKGGHWLRVTVPSPLHDLYAAELPSARIDLLRADGEAPDMMLVTVSHGPHLYAAELRLSDPRLYRVVQAMAETGQCRLVLENLSNGRPLRMNLQWPSQTLPDIVQGAAWQVTQDILEAAEHPAVYAQAQALLNRRQETVFLHRCLVRTSGEF